MAKTDKKPIASKGDIKTSPHIRFIAQPDVLKGVFSNVAAIRHTENEFIIDFLLKIEEEAHLVSRVVFSPPHILALLDALKIDIEKYESRYEKIKKKKSQKG